MTAFEAKTVGDTLEISVYGEIGESWFSSGVTAKQVSDALKGAPGAKTVQVRLNSPGGLAYEGMAIRALLASHPVRTIATVEGLAASAASIVAMGCREVEMHIGSAMMIHEGSVVTRGGKREHERSIASLETLNDGLASVYAARTGKPKADVRELMRAETWLTPAEAVALRLADRVLQTRAVALAGVDLSTFGYERVPSHVRELFAQQSVATSLTGDRSMPSTFSPTAPTWRGKTYEQLRPVERVALKREDPALHERMRNAAPWEQRPFSQLRPAERVALKRANPKLYEQMRSAHT